MGRKRKDVLPPHVVVLRAIVAANVARLIRTSKWADLPTTKQMIAVAKASGVGQETIRRFVSKYNDPDVPDPGLDKIAMLAEAFGVSPAELLTPFRSSSSTQIQNDSIAGRAERSRG